jgi:transcriptional regulator with XRE-family HTH domain
MYMARRKIETPTVPGSIVVDLNSGKALEKALPAVICSRIKFYREKLRMEQKALAAQIGVTFNAVSNWECGRSRPDLNLIPAICEALHISLYDLYGIAAPADSLTSREQTLVDGYRRLSPGHQYAIDKAVETLQFVQSAAAQPEMKKLLFFSRSLAAGAADPTEFEQDAEPFYLYASPEVSRADYVFSVNGDSMEPKYHTGDMVLVEKLTGANALRYGEIGAFIVGNETYIKRYEEDGLHSLNRKYEVLRFGEDQSVYLIGRVVGLVRQKDIPTQEDVEMYLSLRNFARV